METGLPVLEPGTPCMEFQSPSMEPGPMTLESVLDIWNIIHQEWNLVSLTRKWELHTWNVNLQTWNLAIHAGNWHSVYDVCTFRIYLGLLDVNFAFSGIKCGPP